MGGVNEDLSRQDLSSVENLSELKFIDTHTKILNVVIDSSSTDNRNINYLGTHSSNILKL